MISFVVRAYFSMCVCACVYVTLLSPNFIAYFKSAPHQTFSALTSKVHHHVPNFTSYACLPSMCACFTVKVRGYHVYSTFKKRVVVTNYTSNEDDLPMTWSKLMCVLDEPAVIQMRRVFQKNRPCVHTKNLARTLVCTHT
jgi:uncharacterized membrane protein